MEGDIRYFTFNSCQDEKFNFICEMGAEAGANGGAGEGAEAEAESEPETPAEPDGNPGAEAELAAGEPEVRVDCACDFMGLNTIAFDFWNNVHQKAVPNNVSNPCRYSRVW